ncbi:MAG TPA: flavin reductase family protein [Ramlibacter sp.]|nr:flavin reductase family protein [Ramlibacter sp.]
MQTTPTSIAAETGEPGSDLRAFRRCLAQFGTGVTVMTAAAGDERVGVTVNSFSSLSLEPPLVTWAIKHDSGSRRVFENAGAFAVNILAADQIDVSRCFAAPSNDKFAQVAWRTGACGAPLIDNVLATLECETEAMHEGGDHLLFVGRVKQFSRFDKEPLLFVQGRYGVAVDHPGLKAAPEGAAAAVAEGTSLMVLLLFAYQAMSEKFEARRQAVGLTLAQSRVVAVLYQHPEGLAMGDLLAKTYLGARDAEDAVADLVERAYVQRAGDACRLTPRGRDSREAVLQHLRNFDIEQLSALPVSDIESVRNVLSHIINSNRRA